MKVLVSCSRIRRWNLILQKCYGCNITVALVLGFNTVNRHTQQSVQKLNVDLKFEHPNERNYEVPDCLVQHNFTISSVFSLR